MYAVLYAITADMMNGTESQTRKEPSSAITTTGTARQARMTEMLDQIRQAIAEGRAYLKTFRGKMLVQSYDHSRGWAICNNTGSWLDQSSFMVSTDDIRIAPRRIREDRPVTKTFEFDHNGKRCTAISHEFETVWHWPD